MTSPMNMNIGTQSSDSASAVAVISEGAAQHDIAQSHDSGDFIHVVALDNNTDVASRAKEELTIKSSSMTALVLETALA